jgi:hypothetical protein
VADDYVITARLEAKDLTGPGAAKASKSLRTFEDEAKAISRRIQSAFVGAFAVIGSAYGVGRAINAITRLHDAAKTAQIGIAGLLQMNTGRGFVESMSIAASEMRDLRRIAAAGVGETQDYVTGYAGLLSPILQAGGTNTDTKELVRLGIAFGMSQGYSAETATVDFKQAMTSGAGAGETQLVNQILGAKGISTSQFNAMSGQDRLKTLLDGLEGTKDAADAYGKTWGAQLATLVDNGREFVRSLTAPVFDVWLRQLTRLNEWWAKNERSVQRFASGLGRMLALAYDSLVKILPLLGGLSVGALVGRGVMGVQGVLGGVGKALAAQSVWSGMTGQAGGAMGMMKLGAAGGPQGMAASLGIGATVALLSASVLASWKEYPYSMTAIIDTTGGLTDALGRVWQVMQDLYGSSTMFADAGYYVNAFLTGLVESLRLATLGFGYTAIAVKLFFDTALEGMKNVWAILQGDFNLEQARNRQDRIDMDAAMAARKLLSGPGPGEEGGPPVGGRVTNINGPINIKVDTEVNADPARVVIAWGEGMDQIIRNARTSRRLTAPVGAL